MDQAMKEKIDLKENVLIEENVPKISEPVEDVQTLESKFEKEEEELPKKEINNEVIFPSIPKKLKKTNHKKKMRRKKVEQPNLDKSYLQLLTSNKKFSHPLLDKLNNYLIQMRYTNKSNFVKRDTPYVANVIKTIKQILTHNTKVCIYF